MKNLRLLSVLSLLTISTIAYSQTPINGNFILGDTTQVHVITTTNGDTFTGWISGFDQEKVTFIYRGNTLVFNINEIKLVEVRSVNEQQPPPTSSTTPSPVFIGDLWHFEYKVTVKTGQTYVGKLQQMANNLTLLYVGDQLSARIPTRKIIKVEHLGEQPGPDPDMMPESHKLTTTSNNVFVGILLSLDSQKVTFMLAGGSELVFPFSEVKKITLEKSLPIFQYNNNYFSDQQRVFWTPSAFLLKKGDREFRSMVLFNTIDYGASDHVLIGAGLFSIIVGNALTGKVKIGTRLTDNIHVAAGAQALFVIPTFDIDKYNIGLLYGSIAIGNTTNFLNLSVGRGFDSENDNGTTGFSVGARIKTGNNWRMFLEYLQFQPDNDRYHRDNTAFGNAGMSWMKENHQIDFGLMVSSIIEDGTSALPLFAYSYKF